MRRLRTALILTAALVAVGGCASGRDAAPAVPSAPVGSGSRATPATAATTGAVGVPSAPLATGSAGDDARAVCAAVRQAGAVGTETYLAELGRMLAAAGANDTEAERTARRAAQTAVDDWVGRLREQAARATDPQLRVALAELGSEIATLRSDLGSIDQTRLEQLQHRVDQLCGG